MHVCTAVCNLTKALLPTPLLPVDTRTQHNATQTGGEQRIRISASVSDLAIRDAVAAATNLVRGGARARHIPCAPRAPMRTAHALSTPGAQARRSTQPKDPSPHGTPWEMRSTLQLIVAVVHATKHATRTFCKLIVAAGHANVAPPNE